MPQRAFTPGVTRRTLLAAIAAAPALSRRAAAQTPARAPIEAIGIENQYADIIAQVGGAHVRVTAIVNDPNTDPHGFEATPALARRIATARLIVQNGLGYDSWATRLIAATTTHPGRQVLNVQHLLRLPDTTPNPHLWYDPARMAAVAQAIAQRLSVIRPDLAADFHAGASRFITALALLHTAIAAFREHNPDIPVAVTEPVANALLHALGCRILTPFSLQKSVMDGTDPAPQDITTQTNLLTSGKVALFAYNRQVTSPLTTSFLETARKARIPVVGVYETMPTPGFTYQSWMLAEVKALRDAVTAHTSTETLRPEQ